MTYDNQFDQIFKRDSIYIAIFSIIILCFEDPTVGLVETEAVVLVDCKEVASTGFSHAESLFQQHHKPHYQKHSQMHNY